MPVEDERLQQLTDWLEQCLPAVCAHRGWGEVPQGELFPASSDASFRRYFRWQAGSRSLILMDAPPPQEDCRPFVKLASVLARAGVHVPVVLAEDLTRGFLLLDDLGRQTYLEVINAETDLRTATINYYTALYNVLASKVDVQKELGQFNY